MSQHFKFLSTKLDGLYVIERNLIEDNRGFFSRFFCAEDYKELGFSQSIKQMNYSFTKQKGSIRGMHFQNSPYTEKKIVTCVKGTIFDVAVDMRKESPTYLHWHGEVLSADKDSSFYIPDGFAHGFQTLTDNCQLLYIHSEFYKPNAEEVLNAFDVKINIDWPLEVTVMSDRDRNSPLIP
jgi:dTDP-4-dehydrorhamnose 3,5-epimerase